jgi:hypothetical protein
METGTSGEHQGDDCPCYFLTLIISQKEVYTKVIGYLTVLVTAVIPFLQRLFGVV